MKAQFAKPAFWAVLTLLAFGTTVGIVYRYTTSYERNPCEAQAYEKLHKELDLLKATVAAGQPTVIGVVPKGHDESSAVGFGIPMCVVVANLPAEPERGALTLLLDGERMTKIVGRVVDQGKGLVLFTLERRAEDRPAWQRVIGYPDITGEIPMTVGVAAATGGEYQRMADTTRITFTLFKPAAMVSGLMALVFAVAALVTLARSTAILRDAGPASPFSLARFQMAWWLYLITASFLYIWFVTGEYNGVITAGTLVLLGISATTGLAAVTIDTPAGSAAPPAPEAARTFLEDLLYEGNSPTIHRVQIFAWTIVLGFVLLWEVYARFGFPDFDTNLLIMMGISSGFYLGFKAKEK